MVGSGPGPLVLLLAVRESLYTGFYGQRRGFSLIARFWVFPLLVCFASGSGKPSRYSKVPPENKNRVHHCWVNILADELPERSEGKRGGNEPLKK